MTDDLPAPDQIAGAPHPRDTVQLFGQEAAEQAFLDAYHAGRLHSGWLLTGPRGIGKATLAYRLAAFLLAEPAPGGLFDAPPPESLEVPQEAETWAQIRSGAHPRLFVLRRGPNKTGSGLSDVISVDQVRELKDFFHLSAADGGRRVVIVDAADEMNKSAANALLKELEEPPARTTLLLVSHQPSRLLPTIRSRCRALPLRPLDGPALTHALSQAGHAQAGGDALAALSGGSVGDALRVLNHDGLALYAALVGLVGTLPLDRQKAIALADSCTGKAADARLRLLMDLLDHLTARAARAGLHGPPGLEGAPGEAAALARLAPNAAAARDWAETGPRLSARLRSGRALNLDAAALILDTLGQIEETARRYG